MAARGEQRLRILVVRSGGFAGVSREWRVQPDGDSADWMTLIDACPWGRDTTDPASRDRFTWRIEARWHRGRRTASVPDRDLDGPWRELVDRVREESEERAERSRTQEHGDE